MWLDGALFSNDVMSKRKHIVNYQAHRDEPNESDGGICPVSFKRICPRES